MRRYGKAFRLLVSIALPLLAGGVGGWATARSIGDWYPALVKPPFNPPSWVFGPTWTLLYLLMGFALFLVWEKGAGFGGVRKALVLFGAQLFLNALWSFLFFGARSPGWAFADILLLWLFIWGTLILFFKVDRRAGWLLTPYLAWVTFAGVLNYAIWTLNR